MKNIFDLPFHFFQASKSIAIFVCTIVHFRQHRLKFLFRFSSDSFQCFRYGFLKKQQKFIKKNHSQNYFCKSDLPVLFLRSRVDFPSVSLSSSIRFRILVADFLRSPVFLDSTANFLFLIRCPIPPEIPPNRNQYLVTGCSSSGVARDHISITSPAPTPAVSPSHISRPPPDFLTD